MKRNFRWARNLKIALKTQAGNKFRTATALLGIVMGVSTVIIMVAVSQGMRQQVMAQIEAMGTNLLVVNAGAVNIRAGRARTTSRVTTLTLADVRAISQGSREIARLAPAQSQRKQVKYGNLSTNT
ncbi:MAG: ABC transporter permease, partial [Candidatus Marinimicrobia bacterium]|nr:ABC transporter permease [Candidatus Neomarinimicrobiota bacterium]